MRSMRRDSKIADRMATPPGKTGARSTPTASNSRRSTWPASSTPFADLAQAPRRDLLGAGLGLGDAADGEHGAGGADRRIPPVGEEDLLDGLEFLPRGALGVFHGAFRDAAVREEPVGQSDAADEQALHETGLEAPAEDDLGAAPADVDDQAGVPVVLEGVRHAQVDEAGFFPAADDLDPVAEGLLGVLDEAATVAGLAQGVGADDAHVARREFAQALAEAFQAGEGAAGRRRSRVPAGRRALRRGAPSRGAGRPPAAARPGRWRRSGESCSIPGRVPRRSVSRRRGRAR